MANKGDMGGSYRIGHVLQSSVRTTRDRIYAREEEVGRTAPMSNIIEDCRGSVVVLATLTLVEVEAESTTSVDIQENVGLGRRRQHPWRLTWGCISNVVDAV
jgi:hypothetical protein